MKLKRHKCDTFALKTGATSTFRSNPSRGGELPSAGGQQNEPNSAPAADLKLRLPPGLWR